MDRRWTPVLVGAAIVVATFLLAQWPIFEPSTSSTAAVLGNAERGADVFERECASCHSPGGEGGTGRRLVGSDLEPDEIIATIEEGTGIMPAGLVEGGDLADVATYVATISRQP